jgi:tRNA A37 threonylcarbamoyladenosine dehydratase
MMKDNHQFPDWMLRTVQLLGREECKKLQEAHVLVAGLGGVGAMAAEMLVRAGIGRITIADSDKISDTNINRQLAALHSTIGKPKTAVMKERLLDINPELRVTVFDSYIDGDSIEKLFQTSFDYVVDAIDTLTPKILLIAEVCKRELPLVSSMGSGGKTDPSRIAITGFEKTYNCRLAYLLRKKLRKVGVTGGFQVVFSTEQVNRDLLEVAENEANKKSLPGTVSYIPAIFGCMLSSVVIQGISGKPE